MRFVFMSLMEKYPWGGSEELWSRAALQLRQEGHHVAASVLSWPRLSEQVHKLKAAGIRLSFRSAPGSGILAKAWRVAYYDSGWDRLWLRKQKPDLVIFSLGANRGASDWMKFCRDSGIAYSVIVQANADEWWLEDEERAAMLAGYRSARNIFCVSRHNLKLLEHQVGQALPNGSVVWNPWNVVADRPLPWPKEDGVWKLACVGRLDPFAKGQDLLFEAMSRPRWRERPVQVNLYGSGASREGLAQLAEYFQLRNIRFQGHVSDVADIWKENHLLVLPSRYEGLPLALVEAMWCGRPAVVTNAGGSAELCIDGQTGFVATAPAVALVDDALERAWNRRTEWSLLGQAARRRAEKLIPRDPIGDFCRQLVMTANAPASRT